MSGCHQPETKLIKESVENAKMRIDIFSLNTVSVNHELRIQALEKERDLGIDRLKALEDSRGYVAALERQLAHVDRVLTSRIEKLDRLVLDVLHDLEWRITKIESAKSEKEQKVPYKCSVCNGTGIAWGDA